MNAKARLIKATKYATGTNGYINVAKSAMPINLFVSILLSQIALTS